MKNLLFIALSLCCASLIAQAADDSYIVIGESLTLQAPGVVANDGVIGPEWSVEIAEGPIFGKVAFNADGSFTYYAGLDAAAVMEPVTDQFTYLLTDLGNPDATQTKAMVSLTYHVMPSAQEDTIYTDDKGAAAMPAPGVLGNDTGTGILTAMLVEQAQFGVVYLYDDGSFEYAPDLFFEGMKDCFTYMAVDEAGFASIAQVAICFFAAPDEDPTLLLPPDSSGDGADLSLGSIKIAGIDPSIDGPEEQDNGTILLGGNSLSGSSGGEDDIEGACSAGNSASPWMLLLLAGLAIPLTRLRRARA